MRPDVMRLRPIQVTVLIGFFLLVALLTSPVFAQTAAVTEPLSPTAAQTLVSPDGRVTINVPAGAVATTLDLQYTEQGVGQVPSPTDLGLAGFGVQVSSASEDARDMIATGTEPDARSTALLAVVANSASPTHDAPGQSAGRARPETDRTAAPDTTPVQAAVVRPDRRTACHGGARRRRARVGAAAALSRTAE